MAIRCKLKKTMSYVSYQEAHEDQELFLKLKEVRKTPEQRAKEIEESTDYFFLNDALKKYATEDDTLKGLTVKGVAILNGPGDNTDSNHDFTNSIQCLGIVEMSNAINCNPRFNVISSALKTDVKK